MYCMLVDQFYTLLLVSCVSLVLVVLLVCSFGCIVFVLLFIVAVLIDC